MFIQGSDGAEAKGVESAGEQLGEGRRRLATWAEYDGLEDVEKVPERGAGLGGAGEIMCGIGGEGGECGFTHLPDRPDDERQRNQRRVRLVTEKFENARFLTPMNVQKDEDIAAVVKKSAREFGKIDFLLDTENDILFILGGQGREIHLDVGQAHAHQHAVDRPPLTIAFQQCQEPQPCAAVDLFTAVLSHVAASGIQQYGLIGEEPVAIPGAVHTAQLAPLTVLVGDQKTQAR